MFDQWVCTAPDKSQYDRVLKRKMHPRPWELDVQSEIRTMKLRSSDERLVIGVDPQLVVEDGAGQNYVKHSDIGGVSYFGLDSTHSMWMVFLVAVSCRYQGQGQGSRAVAATLAAMRAADMDDAPSEVVARIHPANDPSRRAFKSRGFQFIDLQQGYELWGRDL